jgi:hypothetical protein
MNSNKVTRVIAVQRFSVTSSRGFDEVVAALKVARDAKIEALLTAAAG